MIIDEVKYTYSDLRIVPAKTTSIKSRSECMCYDENGMLPLFTAPMDSVVDVRNYDIYENNKINPIVHRNVSFGMRMTFTKDGKWCAYTYDEFKENFLNSEFYMNLDADIAEMKVLLDIANGHMQCVINDCKYAKKLAKSFNKNLVIMCGNIANPETYEAYCEAGIDYVRCSIGTGSGCLTTANTGIHYPAASLIDDIFCYKNYLLSNCEEKIKNNPDFVFTKIVADGGIKNYDDAIIALACGADYVMIGGLFASFFESCADFENGSQLDYENNKGEFVEIDADLNYVFRFLDYLDNLSEYNKLVEKYNLIKPIQHRWNNVSLSSGPYYNFFDIEVSKDDLKNDELSRWIISHTNLVKGFHGMSTKIAQINTLRTRGKTVDVSKLKTSEGKSYKNTVKYTCKQWTENFESSLKSAMSYTDCRNLDEFIGNVDLVVRSVGSRETTNK